MVVASEEALLSHVMISYCHTDRAFVAKLAEALKSRNCDIWFDEKLRPGDDYSVQIQQRIVDAAAMIVVWSNSACDSPWVRAETLKAFNLKKRLIQVIKEPCSLQVPFNALQFIDLTDWRFDSNAAKIDEIVSVLATAPAGGGNDIDIATDNPEREPRTHLHEIAPFLDSAARIKVVDRIAIGELSDVYRGEYGTRALAIKAFHNSLLSNSVKQTLLAEVAIASNLNHPAFLRISDVLFDKHVCFIVADRVEGGETIARKIETEGAASFSIGEVVDILHQLCEAVVEAEIAGLGYLSITPSQVFVKDDRTQVLAQYGDLGAVPESSLRKLTRKIVRLSPINFAHFKTRFGESGAFWKKPAGPFMPPEFWLGNRWFKDRMEPMLGKELKGDDLRRAKLQKAHQFALGMVAWSMIEGRVPFVPDLKDANYEDTDDLEEIREQFLCESLLFPQRIAEAKWRAEARALARIVERMVHPDPALRWPSMNQVRLLIAALAANYAADDLDDLVKEAYRVVRQKNETFYRGFYESLFQAAPHLRAKFPTDMTRQHQMLDYAIGQLLNFNQQQSEPTTLSQFVARHKGFGLSRQEFETFGNVPVESFDAGLADDRQRRRMMAALEIVIWPGIYYLIQRCTPPEASASRVAGAALDVP
jgi:hemoglobin-like flavoprotein